MFSSYPQNDGRCGGDAKSVWCSEDAEIMNYHETIIKESGIVMPLDIRLHTNATRQDLYYGPLALDYWREETGDTTAPDYHFTASCKIVGDWFDAQDWPTYVDGEGYSIAEGDRQSYEEDGIQYFEVDLSDLRRELFGNELNKYL